MTAASTTTGRSRSWKDRPLVLWGGLVGVLLVSALIIGRPGVDGPPFEPTSSGPLGTRALVLFAEEMGAGVETEVAVPGSEHDVAIVFEDVVADADAAALDDWVEAGGTLVVASPLSDLHPFTPSGDAIIDLFDTTLSRGPCAIDALAMVDELETGSGLVFGRRAGAEGCFDTLDGSFVMTADRGEGTIVAVGGPAPFVNDTIGDADNALLAAALLAPAPGTSVAFIDPSAGGAGTDGIGLGALIGDNVRQALLQLAVAFVLYALWRSRRLGRPVPEAQPVQLAASDLVVAVGNLLHQADRRDQAAAVVADDLRRALASRLGLGADATPGQVATIAADRTGLAEERILAALEPPPLSGPDDLVALAQAAESIRQEVSNVRR